MKSFWIIPTTLLITGCSGIEKITTVLIEGFALTVMACLIGGLVIVIYATLQQVMRRYDERVSPNDRWIR